jgi:tetratricopeptide (TPR) repeat protein
MILILYVLNIFDAFIILVLSQSDQDIRSNIVMLVDSKDRFGGMGFLIELNQKRYCITCHHCISNLDEIFLKRNGDTKYKGEWIEEISDPCKDIAVLKADWDKDNSRDNETENNNKKIANNTIKPLDYSVEIMADLQTSVFSYGLKNVGESSVYAPHRPVEAIYSKLSSSAIFVSWSEDKEEKEENQGKEVYKKDRRNNEELMIQGNGSINKIRLKENPAQTYSRAPISFELYHQKPEIEEKGKHIDELSKRIWNKKPQVQLFAFIFSVKSKQSTNLSGAPVCSIQNNSVVGIVTAKDSNKVYVIPIHTVLNTIIERTNGREEKKNRRQKNIASPSKPTTDIIYNLRKGNESYIEGDYGEAIKRYDIIINDRNYIAALQNMGECLRATGYHKRSIEYFDKALAIDSNYVIAISLKGLTYFDLGSYREAIKCSDKVSLLDPNYITAITIKAASYFGLGDYKQSLEYFDKALALKPTDIDALNGKGVVLLKLGMYEQSIEYLDNALAIDPNNVSISKAKGEAMNKINKQSKNKLSIFI